MALRSSGTDAQFLRNMQDEHNMDYFHPFTIVIITLEDGYYWADGLFMKSEDIVPVLEDYGIQFTERK